MYIYTYMCMTAQVAMLANIGAQALRSGFQPGQAAMAPTHKATTVAPPPPPRILHSICLGCSWNILSISPIKLCL